MGTSSAPPTAPKIAPYRNLWGGLPSVQPNMPHHILHFWKNGRLASTAPTSCPALGTAGVGDLGPAARKFCDWMHRAGLKRWQMLPIGPVGAGDSPYSALSSFAIEPMLASLSDLVSDGWLPASALRQSEGQKKAERGDQSSWSRAREHKLPLLEQAYSSVNKETASSRQHAVPNLSEMPITLARPLDRLCRPPSRPEAFEHLSPA